MLVDLAPLLPLLRVRYLPLRVLRSDLIGPANPVDEWSLFKLVLKSVQESMYSWSEPYCRSMGEMLMYESKDSFVLIWSEFPAYDAFLALGPLRSGLDVPLMLEDMRRFPRQDFSCSMQLKWSGYIVDAASDTRIKASLCQIPPGEVI